jgi:hypothetical protein
MRSGGRISSSEFCVRGEGVPAAGGRDHVQSIV